ncbi:MAG: peptidyl-prolyl cis-trans isomerase [Candidatus Eisenbacteria bacterium]
MLSQLRQNTKIILWLVIVAFVGLIFVVWGMNLKKSGGPEAGYIGKIGHERITVEEYRSEVMNQRAAYYESQGQRPGMQEEKTLADRAWETVVQQHLLWKEAAKNDFMATDEEVLMELQTNPPAFIRTQPIFLTDSVYDHSKYLAALDDPAYDFSFLESYIRSTLPLQKLQEYIGSTVRVTDQEIRQLSRMLEEQVTISYLTVNPGTDVRESIPDPTGTELESFYSNHMEDFRTPEKRKVAYIKFLKQPSAEDERYAREKIEEAHDLVDAGEPFHEIAAEYSDDSRTVAAGGDLGWISRGRLPAVLDSVAYILKPGQMSDVIKTDQGFHLLKLDETRVVDGVEERKLSYILSKLEASPLTIEQVGAVAAEVAQTAGHRGVEEAAAENAYEFAQSEELVLDQFSMMYGIDRSKAEQVFEAARNGVIGPLEGSGSFYVFQVTEIVATRIPPLEEIRDYVTKSYSFDRKRRVAQEMASDVVLDLSRGSSLEQAASSHGLEIRQSQPFTRMSQVPGIGSANAVIAQAFTLSPSATSGVLEQGGVFYVIRVDERQGVDEDRFETNFQGIKMSLLNTKQQAFIGTWYMGLRNATEIEDYRTLSPTY